MQFWGFFMAHEVSNGFVVVFVDTSLRDSIASFVQGYFSSSLLVQNCFQTTTDGTTVLEHLEKSFTLWNHSLHTLECASPSVSMFVYMQVSCAVTSHDSIIAPMPLVYGYLPHLSCLCERYAGCVMCSFENIRILCVLGWSHFYEIHVSVPFRRSL